MNNLLKRENKKRKRNNKNNESFNRKKESQAKTQNKFVNINGKWQKLENKKAGEIKLSANEEFKKSLFGKDESEEYKPIQKNFKKFNENAITEMEKEHSHIFSSTTNLEKILKAQREKYSSTAMKSQSQSHSHFQSKNKETRKNQFKTIIGKNILNYLNEIEISDRNIFSERNRGNYEVLYRIDLNNNFEIPMVTKKDKEKMNYKINFGLNENLYLEFEKVMIGLREGTRKKENFKDSFRNREGNSFQDVEMEDDEDIFAVEELNQIKIPDKEKIKLNLTSNNDEDFFKLKNIDLATLLKPYQKK